MEVGVHRLKKNTLNLKNKSHQRNLRNQKKPVGFVTVSVEDGRTNGRKDMSVNVSFHMKTKPLVPRGNYRSILFSGNFICR